VCGSSLTHLYAYTISGVRNVETEMTEKHHSTLALVELNNLAVFSKDFETLL
jgi:hypothetical protein